MSKERKTILNKMCSIVNAKNINFKKPNWFWDYEWTQEQEDEFVEWLTKHLKENKEARSIMHFPAMKDYEKVAKEFVNQYGWKLVC